MVMEKLSRISAELRDWMMKTLESGVNPESIVQAMIKKGFDPIFAYTTLLRMVSQQSTQTLDTYEPKPYTYELPEIGQKGNIIQTSNRKIKVLMRIEKPFILYLDNVLSADECDELIEISKPRLKPSRVVDPTTGEEKMAPGRTSDGTYYSLNENALITRIETRIAEITNYPIENGEGLQVLHYEVGEEYKPHFDYFPSNKVDEDKGGQRIGTLLIYLNDVPAGGETIFPKLGLSVTPKKGTALYFHYTNSKDQVDRMSLHSSIPVINGEKWVATKWIRQRKILSFAKKQESLIGE